MNLLFCACPRKVYGFFTAVPYPTNFDPFPQMVNKVPDYMGCVDENNRTSKHAKHALDKKTRADIVTMNAALTDVFLDALSLQVHASFQQRCLRQPNIVFVDMFKWFVGHYGKTTAKDCDANRQCMAANWVPPTGLTPSPSAYSPVWHMPVARDTRWTTVTSLTSASASSSGTACMPRNTRRRLPTNPNTPKSLKRLTRSRCFGLQRSRLSTRQRYPLACTATAWLQSTRTTLLCCTASQLQTLAPRTPPLTSLSRSTA
jgi:hypothetical protein